MKILIQAAVVTVLAASTAQAQQAVQWKVSDGGNGHWYEFVRVASTANWPTARQACLARGGDLAVIDSQALTTVLSPHYPADTNACFIGCSFDQGTWRWVNGRAVSWSNWCSCGQPSGDGPAVEIWAGGVWNDVSMWQPRQGYVIEWSGDCNSDGIIDYGQILDGTLTDVNADGIPDVCQAPCVPADLNNDRSVDGADLGVLLSAWGPAGPESARADINGNGIVDGADLGVLLANWGACGEAPPWATVVQWQPDPAVVTDDQLRSAIAATGLPWRVRDAGTQIEMLLVPPGTFQMGCIMGSIHGPCTTQELPVHQVTLTNAFYFGRYEVTQAQ
jgi:hypothetical protein